MLKHVAVSGSTVYAGGSFSYIGGQGRNYIAAIDPSTGNATSWNPNSNNNVYKLALYNNKSLCWRKFQFNLQLKQELYSGD